MGPPSRHLAPESRMCKSTNHARQVLWRACRIPRLPSQMKQTKATLCLAPALFPQRLTPCPIEKSTCHISRIIRLQFTCTLLAGFHVKNPPISSARHKFPYITSPSTTVARAFVCGISGIGTFIISRSSTTKSAFLPGVKDPN